jgi:hypothetical protein
LRPSFTREFRRGARFNRPGHHWSPRPISSRPEPSRRVPGLTYDENAAGEPTRIWRHGQATILLNDTPLLFVDGVRVADIRALGDIPASEIEVIRVRTGLNSSAEFGTNSASGVILVETHTGN